MAITAPNARLTPSAAARPADGRPPRATPRTGRTSNGAKGDEPRPVRITSPTSRPMALATSAPEVIGVRHRSGMTSWKTTTAIEGQPPRAKIAVWSGEHLGHADGDEDAHHRRPPRGANRGAVAIRTDPGQRRTGRLGGGEVLVARRCLEARGRPAGVRPRRTCSPSRRAHATRPAITIRPATSTLTRRKICSVVTLRLGLDSLWGARRRAQRY